jgi:hypothetical protein
MLRSIPGQPFSGVGAMIDTDPERAEHLPILCHVIDRVHSVHRSHQTLLHTFLGLWVLTSVSL